MDYDALSSLRKDFNYMYLRHPSFQNYGTCKYIIVYQKWNQHDNIIMILGNEWTDQISYSNINGMKARLL